MDNKKIAYLGPFAFPNGGAAARRILGNLCSLRDVGYQVIVGSGQLPLNQSAVEIFEGFEVYSIGERTGENLPSLLKYMKYLNIGKRTIEWLDNMEVKPSAIILYSGYSPYLMRLLPWCKRNNVKLIFDAVEWYEAPSIFTTIFSPYFWNIELAMRYYIVKTKNVIAISQYLKNYYQSKGGVVVVVPPTLDSRKFFPNEKVNNDKLVIAYTGTPGNKDLFDNYLEALFVLGDLNKKIVFKVAGVPKEEMFKYPALKKRNITDLPNFIECLGLVSHENAINLVSTADFSVLLRRPTRVAQAGFPTKFVESFTVGTPVIANLTSDLHKYLVDSENGLICKDFSVESLVSVLKNALQLPKHELGRMRNNARFTAEQNFDYRIYSNMLKSFIEQH